MVDVCVVYLVWPPMGAEPVKRFAASYREQSAGIPHRLVVVLKGPAPRPVATACEEILREPDTELLQVPAVGRDLDSYRLTAERVESPTLLLLNTSSEVLAPGWLSALSRALEPADVGIAGCTGSYESALSAAPRPLRPLLRRRFPPFPNPHLRTNAFMLGRDLLLGLRWPAARGKRAVLELESGRGGITRQLADRRLRAVVVGRDGRAYDPEEWPLSRTFRAGGQENLLIADNRTRQYAGADPARRAELARYAWGSEPAPPLTSPPPARAQRA